MSKLLVGLLVLSVQAAGSQAVVEERPLFDPERSTLYSQAELWRGFDASLGRPGWDGAVYEQFVRSGKYRAARAMERARSLHDDGISWALGRYVERERSRGHEIVSVMGNANESLRCSASYRQTAQLGYELAKKGYLVATGGGPGEMEAANLGAYLSGREAGAIDEAIGIMRRRADRSADPTVCAYADHAAYTEAAFDVKKRFPEGKENLGVPTWFYGHEPINVFAVTVAKYFSNAIREDTLLAISRGGVVYTEGGAGMREEIFMRASQVHFASFCYVSPMVFLGSREFGDSGLYAVVSRYASPGFPGVGSYRDYLKLTDGVGEAVGFVQAHPPRRVQDAAGTCENMP